MFYKHFRKLVIFVIFVCLFIEYLKLGERREAQGGMKRGAQDSLPVKSASLAKANSAQEETGVVGRVKVALRDDNTDSHELGISDLKGKDTQNNHRLTLSEHEKQSVNSMVKKKWETFSDALVSQASTDKLIILALVDSAFVDVAANYYITSIHGYDLHNWFLFIALDSSVCARLQESLEALGVIPCFMYSDDPDAGKVSTYGSTDFHRKTNSRNNLILEALKLGYTVLNTDIDLYFVSNPLPEVISTCERQSVSGCDLAPLWDNTHWNSGFVYIRPTKNSIALYQGMVERFALVDRDDQLILNDVIKAMEKKQMGLNLAGLDQEKFANGHVVFGNGMQLKKDIDISQRIVIHNNWIKGKDIKIMRFKLMGMWDFDGDRYYTSKDRKYLLLGNPIEMLGTTNLIRMQWLAIRNALSVASLLNRTLILPIVYNKNGVEDTLVRFLRGNQTRLLNIFDVREDVFLEHPLVPDEVKSSISQPSVIVNNLAPVDSVTLTGVTMNIPQDPKGGPTLQEIQKWYGKESAGVLRIHSMYGDYSRLNYRDILGHEGVEFFHACL